MINDDLLIYLLFQVVILTINLIGYSKIPMILFVGIIGTVVSAIPTLTAFGDYYLFAFILILLNMIIPIAGLTRAVKT